MQLRLDKLEVEERELYELVQLRLDRLEIDDQLLSQERLDKEDSEHTDSEE